MVLEWIANPSIVVIRFLSSSLSRSAIVSVESHKYVMYTTPDIQIQQQHEKLCALLTEMCDMITDADTEYLLIPKFAKFIGYLEAHFEYENEVMRNANYFDAGDHAEVHEQFLDTVNKIYRKSMHSTASLKLNLPVVAKALRHHISLEEGLFSTELTPIVSKYAEFS